MSCDITGDYNVKGKFYSITPTSDSVNPTSSILVSIKKVGKKFYRYEEFFESGAPSIGVGTRSLEDDEVVIFTVDTRFGRQLISVKPIKCKKDKAQKIKIKALTVSDTLQAVVIKGIRTDEYDD